MTTADPAEPDGHVEPPAMLPRDPRPMVDTLRGWPFVLLGTVAVGALAAVTILPGLLADDPQPVREEPAPMRLGEPRGLRGMPLDYSQVECPPAPPPTAPEPKRETPQPPQRTVIAPGGQRSTGPTRAELLKAARMADLAPVGVGNGGNGGTVQANMNGGAPGGPAGGGRPAGKLYNPHGLTPAMPCQVDAGTNIPAMTEQCLTSESPGTVSAVVTRDIWSADKSCLAVPRGTRFVGRYQTAVSEGQARLGILWTGLTQPPPRGDSIELDDTVAGDPDGTAGGERRGQRPLLAQARLRHRRLGPRPRQDRHHGRRRGRRRRRGRGHFRQPRHESDRRVGAASVRHPPGDRGGAARDFHRARAAPAHGRVQDRGIRESMPQRDDKVGVYFGRIDQALWDRLGELPAATIEKAIAALAEARAAGRTISYPAVPKRGIRKKVWLTPETARVLKAIGEEAGYQNTSVILAALDLHLGAPDREASRQGDSPNGTPARSGTP